MAIVLPRGIFKNYTDERVRRFLIERAKIKAVVSLSGSMFKPFTNTKTCVLFIERRMQDLVDVSKANKDGSVLYAVTEVPGKDQSGKLVRNAKGEIVSDLGQIASYLKKNLVWGGK